MCVETAFPAASTHAVSVVTERKEQLTCSGVPVFMKMLSLVGVSYARVRGQPLSGWASLGCVAVAAWSTVHRKVLKPLADTCL